MITVDIKRLVAAVREAERFRLPDMNEGTRYLYNKLYRPLAEGKERRLSDINFESFELDDIESMRDIYCKVLEENESKADALTRALRDIPPIVAVTAFV